MKSVFTRTPLLIRTPKKIVFLCWLATYQTRFYLQSLETSPPTRIQAQQAVQRSCRSRRLQASEAETSQVRYVLITSYLTAFKTYFVLTNNTLPLEKSFSNTLSCVREEQSSIAIFNKVSKLTPMISTESEFSPYCLPFLTV